MKVIWVNSCTTIQCLKVSCIAIECLKKIFSTLYYCGWGKHKQLLRNYVIAHNYTQFQVTSNTAMQYVILVIRCYKCMLRDVAESQQQRTHREETQMSLCHRKR